MTGVKHSTVFGLVLALAAAWAAEGLAQIDTSGMGSGFTSSGFLNSGFGTTTTGGGGRPISTATTTPKGAATPGMAPVGGSGVIPAIFIRDPVELAAMVAAAKRKAPAAPADSATVKGLVEDAASDNSSRKETADKRLGELGESAVPALAAMMRADETPPAQRSAAGRMLALIGPASAPALAALTKDSSTQVRLMAVRTLGTIRDRACLGALRDALSDRDEGVRLAAIGAMGNLGQMQAGVFLAEKAATDPSITVRVAATEALGRVGSRAAIEPLIAGLSDPQLKIRQASVQALVSMCELLASGNRGEMGRSKTVLALASVLADKDPEVRTKAAEGLGLLGDQRAVEKLAPLIADPQAGMAVITALGRIGGAEAREILSRLAREAKDDAVRRAAAEAQAQAQRY